MIFGGRPATDFPVHTADGWPIPNSQDTRPSRGTVELARRTHRLLLASVRQLGPETGRYNCHGLTFASRRTNIPPPGMSESVIDEVLQRDGYVLVHGAPAVGDVVIYRDHASNTPEHSGIVCQINTVGQEPVVIVWSMWGGLGEFEHRVNLSPYQGAIEYWRLDDANRR